MINMLSTLSSRREVRLMNECILTFLVSVGASVVGFYICKWLDRDK